MSKVNHVMSEGCTEMLLNRFIEGFGQGIVDMLLKYQRKGISKWKTSTH